MDVTINGITGKVEWEGFRKARTPDGPTVVIRYQVPYLQGDAFADACMGGIGTPRAICPTNPVLYCLRADVDYFGERNDMFTVSDGQTVLGAGVRHRDGDGRIRASDVAASVQGMIPAGNNRLRTTRHRESRTCSRIAKSMLPRIWPQ